MKEPISNTNYQRTLDVEGEGKLHVLFGGTKVVQHSPPNKNSPGLRGKTVFHINNLVEIEMFVKLIFFSLQQLIMVA